MLVRLTVHITNKQPFALQKKVAVDPSVVFTDVGFTTISGREQMNKEKTIGMQYRPNPIPSNRDGNGMDEMYNCFWWSV